MEYTRPPVGIAAGSLRKFSDVSEETAGLAVSLTFGSFTLFFNIGNKQPNYWFDDGTGMSVNAIKLANDGLEHFLVVELPQILKLQQQYGFRIRVSLAPQNKGELRAMMVLLFKYPLARFIHEIEINIACPNHRKGKRLLEVLAHDLRAVKELLKELPEHCPWPLALKLAPGMRHETLEGVVSAGMERGIRTFVSGNTFKISSIIDGVQRLSVDFGGMGGTPLLEMAVQQVATLRFMITKMFPVGLQPTIIGCGGVMDAESARRHFDAGADEIQIGTLFYHFRERGLRDLVIGLA